MTGLWTIEERGGLSVAVCLPLLELHGIGHAFSTRRADGRADFDIGSVERTDDGIEARRRRLCRAAGLSGRRPSMLRQVHGSRLVRAAQTSARAPRADGVIEAGEVGKGPVPAVRTADCVPILIADRRCRAVAAVHGGWRGAAAGIAGVAVRALDRLGVGAERLVVALGPAIGDCCYEVGAEVGGEVARACGVAEEAISSRGAGDRRQLDLHAAHRLQLEAAGIPASSIHAAPWCTACHSELFFSYRRDGAAGGRQMAVVGRIGLP